MTRILIGWTFPWPLLGSVAGPFAGFLQLFAWARPGLSRRRPAPARP